MISFYNDHDPITGSHFYHYGSCKTRLWLINRNIEVGKDNDHIRIGKHLDSTTHVRNKKSLTIQGLCQIDYLENRGKIEVHEIKKGDRLSEAIELQIMYYLQIMKELTGETPVGYVHLPEVKKVVEVKLSENIVEDTMHDIKKIIDGSCPIPRRIPICHGCAYEEMCWA